MPAIIQNGHIVGGGEQIDDTTTSVNKVWSSQKTSGEITDVYEVMGQNGAVNYLNNIATTTTANGVTFTVNSDKSISTSNIATANASIELINSSIYIKDGIIRGCPKGGSNSTYSLAVYDGSTWIADYGDGLRIQNKTISRILVYIANGQDASGLTFYPMICSTDYKGSYAPYAKTNRELTENYKTGVINQIPQFTLNTDKYTNNEPNGNCYYYVKNGVCFVTLTVNCVSPQNANIDTGVSLPAPSKKGTFGALASLSDGSCCMAYITTTGQLYLRGGVAGKYHYGSISYAID